MVSPDAIAGGSRAACGGRVRVETSRLSRPALELQDIDSWTPRRFLRRHAQRASRRRRLQRLLLWGSGAFLVWGFLFAEDGLVSLAARSGKLRQLQQRVAQLQTNRDWLREEIARRESDPVTLERLAREEYGMIRPGERVVRIRPVDEAEARRFEEHHLQPSALAAAPTH